MTEDKAAARSWAERLNGTVQRVEACAELRRLGPSIAPVLVEILDGQDEEGQPYSSLSRRGAAMALGQLKPPATCAIGALVRLLEEPDAHLRAEAATALGHMGGAAQCASTALTRVLLHDADLNAPGQAAWALGRVGGPDALRALLSALTTRSRTPRAWCRAMAVRALGDMGVEAKDAIPALLDSLKDAHELLRKQAASALRRIDPTLADQVGAT